MSGNLLIVWDRIGDYHRARIRAVKKRMGAAVVFTADLGQSDTLYRWENTSESTNHRTLSSKPVHQRDIIQRARAFRSLLREKQIRRVAIAGYGRPEYIIFLILARLNGCRVTLFAESWYGRNPIKNRLKGWLVRATCRQCFVSGERAREHFHERMGVPLERLFTGYSVVDNDHFAVPAGPREPVFLCVARFSPEKNLDLLIEAFLESTASEAFQLHLIGGGPEESRLRERAGGSDRIRFMDWVSYADLPGAYARACFFVLPSRFEPWGLVVNEAMAAGLPVVVSDACGCQPDLVRDGVNGVVFPAGDKAALVRILDRMGSLDPANRDLMGTASREMISDYDCDTWAQKLLTSFD